MRWVYWILGSILFLGGFWGVGWFLEPIPVLTHKAGGGGDLTFRFSSPSDPYLTNLRETYELEALVASAESDFERVQLVMAWVHGLWKHHGSNQPQSNDPISILEAVSQGERFRCVEYGIVLAGALNSLGIPARQLGLKTADVETRKSSAGHVVTEAYLPDLGKWVFLDGQINVAVELDGVPLNAVEFQHALSRGERPKIVTKPDMPPLIYFRWVQPYLYYFDAPLDNRYGAEDISYQGLMLVPLGASNPQVFQRHYSIGNLIYTHSIDSFYPRL